MVSVSAEYLAEDSGGTLVGISIAFAVLTTLFLGLRLFSKRFTAVGYGADDVFLVAAYFFNLLMCAVGIAMVHLGGVGRHIEYVEETNPVLLGGWAKCILVFEIVYFIGVGLPKMGIVCLYLRVFAWKGTMRTIALTVLALLGAQSLSFVITAFLQCRPIAYWWDRSIAGGVCINVQAFFHAQAVPGIILDLVIMALPMKTIWNLKLPLFKRCALVGIFAIGSFGFVASIIRAVKFFSTAAFTDRTWASVSLVGWSIIEIGTYIIAACLPHLRPVVSHYAPESVKSWLRSTISQTSASVSKNKLSRRERVTKGDDEVELTCRSDGRIVRRGSEGDLDSNSVSVELQSPGKPFDYGTRQNEANG